MAENEPSYHHGDLRAELVKLAIEQVEQGGAGKISLRKLAAEAGVSHNAPYMHFANKDAVLEAAAAEGFSLLRVALAEAGLTDELQVHDWRERLKTGFAAYVQFALERPRLYALMHQPQGTSATASDDAQNDPKNAGPAALTRLTETLATGQRLGLVRDGDPDSQALSVWVTLHGLAGLTGDARRSFGQRSPEEVTDTVLDQLLDGLSPPTP